MPAARRSPTVTRAQPSRRSLVVLTAALVHCALSSASIAQKVKQKGKSAAAPTRDGLPVTVAEMRDLILAAIQSGDIEDLRPALQWNELPPEVADSPVSDPIAHWRNVSTDGAGREILAVLSLLLDRPPAVLPLGRDIENNRLYVWPAIAERPIRTLSPADQVELLRLVPFAEAKRMTEAGRYDGWRLAIGADGTWHSFRRW